MKELIIKTQKEFDEIKSDFEGVIIIEDTKEWLNINHSFENADINVYDSATINNVFDSATIILSGLACICFLFSAKKIVANGINMIRQIGTTNIDITKSKSVNFIQVKETIEKNPTFDFYTKTYPVKTKGTKVIMYKSVRKFNGKYVSDKDNSFEYIIGEIKEEKCDKSNDNSCSFGIHISHKMWALQFGRDWDNMALLEVEVDKKDIVVSKDCDGKVRTSKIKVLREVPKNEWYD